MARFPEVYRKKAWKKVRKTVIRRANGLCEKCYPKEMKRGIEVDHVIELTEENKDKWEIAYNPDNLQLLCTDCHNHKHDRSIGLQNFITPP
jgi:5-methylcytosine-specific restriction endonuclease McrA